ncbi:uncharacterized protein CG3556-like [Haematobia irritans]|uniref:Putative secreted protein n=1 Tax=Haematobia irritans TaxID=7368 RepID=A0A1L8E9E5_HAEIR
MSKYTIGLFGRWFYMSLLLTQLANFGPHAEASLDTDQHVSYTYSIWVGSNISEEFMLPLRSPENTTFYQAMIQAATMDSRYHFESKNTNWGHYISKIAGVEENIENNIYWLIYSMEELPDPNNKPGKDLMSPVGVDLLIVKNGGHYLFWYRDLDL